MTMAQFSREDILRYQGREEGWEEGREEGREEGERNRARKIADLMLTEGKFSIEEVVNLTELSLEEVKELQMGRRG